MFKTYLPLNIERLMQNTYLSMFCRRTVEMKLITLYLPEPYIRALDSLVNERFYPNRAEAIRVAIRDLIVSEVWEKRQNGNQKS